MSERGDRDRNLNGDGDLELGLIGADAGERGERPRIINTGAVEGSDIDPDRDLEREGVRERERERESYRWDRLWGSYIFR